MSITENRITLKRVNPNPLFQEWLEELHEEAKEKKNKLEPMLREALDSLSKYPLPLKSGIECMILKGFHKKLCLFLDKRMEAYTFNLTCQQINDPASIKASASSKTIKEDTVFTSSNDSEISCRNIAKKTQSVKSSIVNGVPHDKNNGKIAKRYKPAYRSGGFAILIALLEHSVENPDKPSLIKEDLIDKAQKYSEESFTHCKPDSFYTAWSNMSRLITKGLVTSVRSKTNKYYLTEQGKIIAEELAEENKSRSSVNDIIFNNAPSTSSSCSNPVESITNDNTPSSSQNLSDPVIEMPAGTFDIILLIDKNETGGVNKKNDATVAQFNKFPDLKHEYRSLKVGDFTWVARDKQNQSQELVLPYVIERKRMDDLGASIKDGRFHEQKFRLKKCGLQNILYLIENYGSNKHVGLPVQHLMQAIANTRVQDGFKVHTTDSLTNTARFLAIFTKRLTVRYMNKNLRGCNRDPQQDDLLMTFEYFNKSSAKTKPLTVKETFIKLLLQLKGVSLEKAFAITSKYSTPQSLIRAYRTCDRKEGEFLLSNLKYGNKDRNVGPRISKYIYQLFTIKASSHE